MEAAEVRKEALPDARNALGRKGERGEDEEDSAQPTPRPERTREAERGRNTSRRRPGQPDETVANTLETLIGILILIAIIPGGARALGLLWRGLGAVALFIIKRSVLGAHAHGRRRRTRRGHARERAKPDDGGWRREPDDDEEEEDWRPGRDGEERDESMDAVLGRARS